MHTTESELVDSLHAVQGGNIPRLLVLDVEAMCYIFIHEYGGYIPWYIIRYNTLL